MLRIRFPVCAPEILEALCIKIIIIQTFPAGLINVSESSDFEIQRSERAEMLKDLAQSEISSTAMPLGFSQIREPWPPCSFTSSASWCLSVPWFSLGAYSSHMYTALASWTGIDDCMFFFDLGPSLVCYLGYLTHFLIFCLHTVCAMVKCLHISSLLLLDLYD